MTKHVLDIRILPEEYDAFVRLLPNDESFPRTYDGWLKKRTEENAKYIAHGDILDEVIVHPQELSVYAAGAGLPLSTEMLRAAAVKKFSRQQQL